AVNDNGTPDNPTDDGIDYTPFVNYHGLDSFEYEIEDANGDTSRATVLIEVIPVNDLPTAVDDTLTVDEDSMDTRINVLVNDDFGGDGPNTGGITLPEGSVTGQDDTGQVNPTSNDGLITVDDNGTPNDPTDDTILYSPAPNYNGLDEFNYAITDGNGDVSIATVYITVNAINDLPIAEIDFLLTVEDAPLTTINVTENDDFGGDGPSSTPITIASGTSSAGGVIAVNDNGTPTDPTDDGIDYTPMANYFGNDSFEYTITDSDGDTSTTPVYLYLDAVNDLPMAEDDSATVIEDSGITVIDVTSNDDFGGDGQNLGSIIIGISTTPNGSDISVNSNGTPDDPSDDKIDYTPALDFNGTDSFDYTITDSDGDTSTAIVRVTVTPVIDVKNDIIFTNEDTPEIIDILGNDNDISNTTTITVIPPVGGVVDIDTNNTPTILDDVFTYTPVEDYNGLDLFSYEVCESGDCYSTEVLISIKPKLDVEDDFYLIKTNTINPLPLFENDNDIPHDGSIVFTNPGNGVLVYDDRGTPNNPSDDLFTYTPNTDFVGEDMLEYTVCDVDNPSYCETGTVTILVAYAGANDDEIEVDEDGIVDIFMLQNDLDIPQTGRISFEDPTSGVVELMNNGTIDDQRDDYFVYKPNVDFNGSDSFMYTVCDQGEYCTSAMVNITVNPILDVIDDIAETNENSSIDISIFGNDNDIPVIGTLSLSAPNLGVAEIVDNGTANDISDDYVSYTPNDGLYGNDSFTYTVCDNNGNCGTAMVSILIIPNIILSNDQVVTEYETPIDIFILDNDEFVPSDGLIAFTNPSNGVLSINDNNTLTDTSDDFVEYTPNDRFYGFDEFTYTITDVNDPNNSATATVSIEVLLPTTFVLPNEPGSNNKGFGFSPNGDGQNDVLRIHSYNGEVFIEELYPNFSVEIFNRWGDRLYEYSHTGGSNTPQPGWDGTSQGKRNLGAREVLPTGTYFYTVFFNDGIREPYSGWIYLSK
ncbi:Ig-like domain-containing protein, partial [Urechidicola vernalis]